MHSRELYKIRQKNNAAKYLSLHRHRCRARKKERCVPDNLLLVCGNADGGPPFAAPMFSRLMNVSIKVPQASGKEQKKSTQENFPELTGFAPPQDTAARANCEQPQFICGASKCKRERVSYRTCGRASSRRRMRRCEQEVSSRDLFAASANDCDSECHTRKCGRASSTRKRFVTGVAPGLQNQWTG